jgi:hypothetical protein
VDGSAMDFFEQQEQARRQTKWLLAYFAGAAVVIGKCPFFDKKLQSSPNNFNIILHYSA